MPLIFSVSLRPVEGIRLLDVDRLVDGARVVSRHNRKYRIRVSRPWQVQVDIGDGRVFEVGGWDHERGATSPEAGHCVHGRHVEINLQKV